MKNSILAIVILFLIPNLTQGQIVSGTINKVIPCCSNLDPNFPPIYADSLDIDSDNIYEIKIQSSTGIDGYSFHSITMPNVQTNGTVLYGASFPTTWWGAGLPTTIFSSWGSWWLPNTAYHYMGFRRINSPSDTTYGWVKLDFKGSITAPLDTMYMLEYGYNTIPNSPIWAGQVTPLSTREFNKSRFELFPNPITKSFSIRNISMNNYNVTLFDMTGRCLKYISNVQDFETQIDIDDLTKGVYIITIQNKDDKFSQAIIKE